MDFSSGVILRLASDDACSYEVVSIEEDGGRCWLRRSPQPRNGTAAFPVVISQLRKAS
jgi:hypothetical protein